MICQSCHNGRLLWVTSVTDGEEDTYNKPMYCETCKRRTTFEKLSKLMKFQNSKIVKFFKMIKGNISLFKFALEQLGFWEAVSVFTKRK